MKSWTTSDASVALVIDGQLFAALGEERLNRTKRWYGVPHGAMDVLLEMTGLTLDDVDVIATHGMSLDSP